MVRYVVDSWAWFEYLDGSAAGELVREKIQETKDEFFTHSVSLAEIVSKVRRQGKDVETAWRAVNANSKVLSVDKVDSREAGLVHARMKTKVPNFSLGDAFVLAASEKLGATVLTGDPDFEGVENAVIISSPRFDP